MPSCLFFHDVSSGSARDIATDQHLLSLVGALQFSAYSGLFMQLSEDIVRDILYGVWRTYPAPLSVPPRVQLRLAVLHHRLF
jgi:hypothetical protein